MPEDPERGALKELESPQPTKDDSSATPDRSEKASVSRETCLDRNECETDACTPQNCRTYRTSISVRRVKTTRSLEDQLFIKCEPTGQEIGPFNPNEIAVYTQSFKLAEELEVRPKDVWWTLVESKIGKTPQIDPAQCFDGGKFIPKLLGDLIMQKYTFITMEDNQEIYVYIDGCYRRSGEVIIKKECRDQLQEEFRKNRASEVIEYIKVSTYRPRIEEPSYLIPVENGIFNLEKMMLEPHSPSFQFFNKIPVKYNPEATCPNIEKFHSEITNGPEDVTILEEVIGFCLLRDYHIAKALMLVGNGANGKSTCLSLVKRFLGVENVSGRSLQDLESNRFAKADLYAKYANIYADLPSKSLHETGTFKMLTGSDLITAERKFQHPFSFVNYAKLLFSANKVPEVYDDTNAFFRRWIIIVFPNEFTGDDADPHILEKLTSNEELSGLLNKALTALQRLREKGQFSHSKTTEEIREDYKRKSSPIAAFIMDCLEADSDAFIEKKQLYYDFAEYCRNRALPTVGRDTFFKNLPQHVAVSDFRPHIEKRRFTAFNGMRYRVDGWSGRSMGSRVFYTLIEKRESYQSPYKVVELNDKSYIKIELPLDRIDRLDQKPDLTTTENATSQEIIEKVKYLDTVFEEDKLVKRIMDAGKSREDAKRLFEFLVKQEMIGRDPEGLWHWTVRR